MILSVTLVAYNIRNDESDLEGNDTIHQLPLGAFVQFPTYLNDSEWQDALNEGNMWFMEEEAARRDLPSLKIHTPGYKHQKTFSISPKALKLTTAGYVYEYASRYTRRKHNKLKGLICNEKAEISCEKPLICKEFRKYRSYDGSCNNLHFPFGVALRPFRRILSPDYEDGKTRKTKIFKRNDGHAVGVSAPRRAKNGASLPSARRVSLVVHRPIYKDDPKFTVMLAVWGQFLDHDMTATAPSRRQDGSTISCCVPGVSHPDCYPVPVDEKDPFSKYNVSCMEFVRSAPAESCCLGPRQQMNQVSSYVDGSVVYGADDEKVRQLRTFQNGTLKMHLTEDGRELLPVSQDVGDGCNREEEMMKGRYCFMTGR